MLEEYLHKYFQFNTFRLGQKEVITSVLNGHHTMAMLPTGTGKSLCYQLSGYLMDGQVIIVSPLLSLMQDQVEQMKMNGEKRVAAINSFLTGHERKRVMKNLDQYKFIWISPESLANDQIILALKKLNLSLFVIDEAHCISQWGYDFRPDYLRLGEVRGKLGNPLTLSLTATATKEVVDDIIQSLLLENCQQYLFSVDRPNIALAVEQTNSSQEKLNLLYDYAVKFQGPGIIYFSSKKMSEQAADFLHSKGISRVTAYHGGMDQESRILIQQQFLYDQLDIICATSAFGMGINKENIRFVIHFHMPQQIESYLQEIGRAGRDGKPSIALLLYSPGDEQIAYGLAESEIPSSVQLDWLESAIKNMDLDWFNHPESQEELKKIGGFSDIQWRLLRDHFFHQQDGHNGIHDLHQFKQELEKRKNHKRRKVAFMTSWCQTTACRRQQILDYFQEQERESKIENCCDICGIHLSSYHRNQNQKDSLDDLCWKHRLAKLLLKK